MKRLLLIFSLFWPMIANAQVFTEQQTRHRFAQLTLGLDYQTNLPGETSYLNSEGALRGLSLNSLHRPRFIIGGTHFWGHADFLIAIPLTNPTVNADQQTIRYESGVETVFKYYPWKIRHHKIRPYLGMALASMNYEQSNGLLEFGDGPELNHTSVPVVGGLTYNTGSHLIEVGGLWNYANSQDYWISRDREVTIETSPLYLHLTYKFMLETTLSAEQGWESGQTEGVTTRLAEQKRLNGFHFGLGLSSAFWIGQSSYNENARPYIGQYLNSVMPDFTLGYYLHQPDLGFALAYRGYSANTEAYGVEQRAQRRSLVLEATKFLFDYHGFVPFAGPALSYEQLGFQEWFEGEQVQDVSDRRLAYGLTFGWDIRPNRIQTWLLRTNLRWFPNLNLEIEEGRSVGFDAIEFNFIQLIIYPNRMIKSR
jgi:hypothetical protein